MILDSYGLPQSFLFSKGNSNLDEIDSSPPEAAAPGVPENLAPVTLPVTLLPFQPPSPPVFRTAQEMATIPILEDLSAYVTLDKLLPPSLTCPWAHLGQNWPGIDWLNTEKSEKIDPKIPPRPKQSHLKAAFDYAARQHLQSSPPSLPNAIRYDSKNGRAILPSPPSSPNRSSYDLFNLEGKKALPKAQVESDNLEENLEIQEKRREYVKAGFLHSWNSYKEVWGHDE